MKFKNVDFIGAKLNNFLCNLIAHVINNNDAVFFLLFQCHYTFLLNKSNRGRKKTKKKESSIQTLL